MQSLASTGSDGIVATLINMIKQEGLLRPIRGMGAMVFGAGPSHALYFSSYEYLKETFTEMVPSTKYNTLCYGNYLVNNAGTLAKPKCLFMFNRHQLLWKLVD